MTQQRRIGSGQVGQARQTSAADPRGRRNADNQAGDRDIGPGLRINSNGKLTPNVRGPITMRGDFIDFDLEAVTDASLEDSPVSVNSDGRLAWTPADRVDELNISPAVNLATIQALFDKQNELIAALSARKLLGQ